MRREELHKGRRVKLLTDYSNVPAGTWATVDSTGSMKDGAWRFTVRWHHYRPIEIRFPQDVAAYSINLWESDLALFEVVSDDEVRPADKTTQETHPSRNIAPLSQLRGGWQTRRRGRIHPNQLSLFLADDF